MKIPSLFRTPRYQRFSIEPRYYDPVKEEIEERTSRIRQEMAASDGSVDEHYGSRLSGSFRKRSKSGGSATLMQLVIMVLLAFLVFGYIYLGNLALYVTVTISTLLLYLKMKRII